VQRPLYLPDGSMMRLTIARYYTPTGRLIQKPYEDGKEEYEKELYNRYQHGEFLNKDSINLPDSLKYKTLKNKRIVYGGGGIMPDVFVPLDTTSVTDLYSKVIRQGVLNSFVLKYIDENRRKLKSNYPNFEVYNSKFVVTDKILKELWEYSKENKIESNDEEFENSKNDFRIIVKALIARDLWDMSEYFQIVNIRDKGYNKALEIIRNWDYYHEQVLNAQ